MKTIRASWIVLRASAAYLSGRINEAECRRQINTARALAGRPPIADDRPS